MWNWSFLACQKAWGRTSLREKCNHHLAQNTNHGFQVFLWKAGPSLMILNALWESENLFIRTDFQGDRERLPQFRSLRGSRSGRCQPGCCCRGRTWNISWYNCVYSLEYILMFIVAISSENLVFVPLLPPLVPPRLPPLHGLNTCFWTFLILVWNHRWRKHRNTLNSYI